MSGIIPKKFINELIYRTNIIDIINKYIPLKKVGKNYNTHCPFHKETTPSFTVNYEKQFYFCFGCNAHGNVIDFLMNYEQLTFIESIEELSVFNGLTIPYKNNYTTCNYEYRNNLYILIQNISDIYHNNIFQTKSAYQYLINRGINKTTIKQFHIGFSTSNWYTLEKKIHEIYYNQKELIDIGILIINSLGHKYDRFKNRIIFPIRNKNGITIGFGGRNLTNALPKYINSPETQIFHKNHQLYGLYEMLQKISKPKEILVVEGYIDVITLVQFKIENVISTLGTAISDKQMKLLLHISNTIIFCYDGDLAGKSAAWRTLKISLSHIHDGKNIKFIFLPNNEDPDSIIKNEGTNKFQTRIKNSINFSDFLFFNLFKKANLNSISEKINISKISISLIEKIPGKITQIYLLQILSRKVGILDYNIFKILNTKKNTNINENKRKPIKQTIIRTLVALLIQNPRLALTLPSLQHLKDSNIVGITFFLNLVNRCISIPHCNTAQILETYRNTTVFQHLNNLAKWDHMIHKKKIETVFLDLITKIYEIILENKYNKLLSKEKQKGLSKNEKYELWSINKKLVKI